MTHFASAFVCAKANRTQPVRPVSYNEAYAETSYLRIVARNAR